MSDALSASDNLNPANDFLEPADVSNEGLCKLMRNAYMEAEIKENAVYVYDGRPCWVTPEPNADRIWLAVYYSFKGTAAKADRLEYVNRINDVLPIIRAYVGVKSGDLSLDWCIPTEGGITRRAVVYAVKRFLRLINQAIDLDTGGLLP